MQRAHCVTALFVEAGKRLHVKKDKSWVKSRHGSPSRAHPSGPPPSGNPPSPPRTGPRELLRCPSCQTGVLRFIGLGFSNSGFHQSSSGARHAGHKCCSSQTLKQQKFPFLRSARGAAGDGEAHHKGTPLLAQLLQK